MLVVAVLCVTSELVTLVLTGEPFSDHCSRRLPGASLASQVAAPDSVTCAPTLTATLGPAVVTGKAPKAAQLTLAGLNSGAVGKGSSWPRIGVPLPKPSTGPEP